MVFLSVATSGAAAKGGTAAGGSSAKGGASSAKGGGSSAKGGASSAKAGASSAKGGTSALAGLAGGAAAAAGLAGGQGGPSGTFVAKAGSKVPGMGGGNKRSEGGCCTLCPSRFYGPQNYGAPPFSEPGNREQNIVAGSMRGLYRPDGLHPRVGGLTSDQFNNDPKMYDPQGVLSP